MPPADGLEYITQIFFNDISVMHNLCVNKIIYLVLLTLDLPASDMRSLLQGGVGWITHYPLLGAGRVVVDFIQFIPHCMCQMHVHANF